MQMAIIEYLDETRGPPYLLPRDDPVKRQQVHLTCSVHGRFGGSDISVCCALSTWYAGESSLSVCGMWNTASPGEGEVQMYILGMMYVVCLW